MDLVTLDDLSAEAMLESSQRIEQLADVFRRREEPLSDPGAPAGLPPSVRSANVFKQATALFVCWSVYSQPGALSRWLSHLVLAVALSLCLGVVWWDVAASDPQLLLGDRVGFLYATLVVLPWPLLLLQSGWSDTWWRAVADDVRDRLYGRVVYILSQVSVGITPLGHADTPAAPRGVSTVRYRTAAAGVISASAPLTAPFRSVPDPVRPPALRRHLGRLCGARLHHDGAPEPGHRPQRLLHLHRCVPSVTASTWPS